MQTIGKIINGKYVRYGAVSVGDKLGDAAFANIVNNATTTEEGFVPDARVVAQQQQIITQQQEQIDSLNSAIEVLPSNLMVNAKYNAQAISGIAEYFRYTVIGHICLVEIGGIVLTGTQKSICTELPVAKTRPLGFIQNNYDSSIGTVVYGVIGGAYLNIEYNAKLDGRPLYGCILYFV